MTICCVSDPNTAGALLGGKFERENCGYFSTCSHIVEKYDTVMQSYAEITYCEINWTTLGPLLLIILFILYRIKKTMVMPDMSSWRSKDPSHGGGHSNDRHRHHRY